MMKRVLSTKQLSEEELIHAQSLALDVECVQVIATHSLPFLMPESNTFDAVAFTSANALKYFFSEERAFAMLKNKSVFSICGKTKQYLTEQGFNVSECAQNSALLSTRIIDFGVKSVLHPCSKIKLNDLEKILISEGIRYSPLPVYYTMQLTVSIVSDNYNVLLFFSPSGVESFLKRSTLSEKALCCCIGATTAAYLQSQNVNNRIVYPQTPSASAMMSLVASLET